MYINFSLYLLTNKSLPIKLWHDWYNKRWNVPSAPSKSGCSGPVIKTLQFRICYQKKRLLNLYTSSMLQYEIENMWWSSCSLCMCFKKNWYNFQNPGKTSIIDVSICTFRTSRRSIFQRSRISHSQMFQKVGLLNF